MDKIIRSILQQKARKTYARNQLIRELYLKEQNMAAVGRYFKLSRQSVRRILRGASDGTI